LICEAGETALRRANVKRETKVLSVLDKMGFEARQKITINNRQRKEKQR